jgi:hypothetical protein
MSSKQLDDVAEWSFCLNPGESMRPEKFEALGRRNRSIRCGTRFVNAQLGFNAA